MGNLSQGMVRDRSVAIKVLAIKLDGFGVHDLSLLSLWAKTKNPAQNDNCSLLFSQQSFPSVY